MARRPSWIAVMVMGGAAIATVMTTMSPSSAAQEVRLTAAGDYGAKPSTALVLAKVAEIGPDAHLALGDLAYGDSTDEYAWCSFVKQHVGEGFPFELVSGNHESNDWPNGQINNFSACLPNQIPGTVGTYGREYYMDFPAAAPLVRVIQTSPFINFPGGMWTYTKGDAHYNWLAAAIDDGRASGAQWIIVTSHYPCESVGSNECPNNKDFYDLLLAKRVDLVLHGHEHSYARTHQLRSGVADCATVAVGAFNTACVADSDSAFIAGQGSVFATVGTGGTPLRNVNPGDSESGYFAAWSGLNSNPTYGVLDIRISDEQLAASFVPASGGNFTDTFTITKGAPPASTTTSSTSSTSTTSSTTSTTVPATTTLPPAGGVKTTPIPFQSSWRYRYDLAAPATDWATVGFDDTTWDAGAAPIGWGSASINTDINRPGAERAVTLYQRRTVDVQAASTVTSLQLSAIVDDGAVVYVNGTEVNRTRMSAGTVNHGTYANGSISTTNARANPTIIDIPVDLLIDSTNVIAVETHLNYRTTPNISFDLQATLTTKDEGTTTSSTSTTTSSTSTTTSSTSTTTTTSQPPTGTLASDSFTRSVASGWGAANVGGPWTVSGSSAFAVDGSAGGITFSAGGARVAHLRSVSSDNTDMLLTLSSDKIATGSGLYVSVVARSVVNAGEYRGVLRMRPDGRLGLSITRDSVVLVPEVLVPSITYASNVPLKMRVQATGTGPTTIRAKVWPIGAIEPSTWSVTATDNTPSMQTAGSIGLNTLLSSSASNAPIALSIDDLLVTTP